MTWVQTPTVTRSYVLQVIGQKEEHLAMADIPEAIYYRELDKPDLLRLMLDLVTIPIKMLQGISIIVGRIAR